MNIIKLCSKLEHHDYVIEGKAYNLLGCIIKMAEEYSDKNARMDHKSKIALFQNVFKNDQVINVYKNSKLYKLTFSTKYEMIALKMFRASIFLIIHHGFVLFKMLRYCFK